MQARTSPDSPEHRKRQVSREVADRRRLLWSKSSSFRWLLRLIIIFITNLMLNYVSFKVTYALVPEPNRHTVASIPGDLVLGILVPVHERPSPNQAQTRTCGAVREQYGIQRVEAAFRTIDSINNDPKILPNITLGIEIRDSCWYSPIALEQSIEFIRNAMAASEQSSPLVLDKQSTGVISNNLLPLNGINSQDSANNSPSICAPLLRQQQVQLQQQALAGARKVKNVVGVVGPASSTDTVQVQNLLQLFNMPQVGYSATSRDLSNKNFFKYFLRVVPSDKLQAQVMIDLMLAHNWTYVTVAYTEGSYGSSLMNAFRERALEVGICFATLESMPPNADDAKFDELIEAIEKHPNARVVICMCEGRTVGKLFSGFKRKNISNEYLVVGSDGWSDRFDVVERQEDFALGGISIRIHSAYVSDFDDYYFKLNPFTNQRNPWFAEFWETRFQCNLELPGYPPGGSNGSLYSTSNSQLVTQRNPPSRPAFIRPPGAKVYNRSCTGRESLRLNHKQDAKMAFVQKSIITMALGLDSMQRSICPPNKPGLCPEMLPVNGSILLQHLMNVSFSFLNEEVYFDEQGDPPGKYEILNFRRREPDRSSHFTTSSSSDQEEAVPDPYGGVVSESYPETSASDYSIATAVQEQRRRQDPLYDSYASLKVYRAGRRTERRHTPSRERSRLLTMQQEVNPGYGSTSAGYEYVHVGSWKSSDGLSLFGDIEWPSKSSPIEYHDDSSVTSHYQPSGASGASGSNRQPKSVCSLPCAKGHAKKIQSDSVKCCWVCIPCHPNEYLFNEFKCKACDKGWWPNADKTGCDQIAIQYFNWQSMEGITAIGIAIFGLILTLATAVVFIRRNNTPVVKSSTRELSYMILFAMVLCYANTFFLVAKPHKVTCFATRLLPGFAFAMMYGALVTKTNRIARILAGSKKKIITRRPRFMSATAQVAITWIIVLIECGILVFMLIKEPADRMLDYPSDDRVVLVCNTTTMGIIAPLGFDFFLIAMCTLYAFKTRNVPENFNEAKFIGFTMYTTLVIWVAFVVIYFSSEHKVTTMSLCISFSALFALFLLFFPRCYIIIFKPEKNNRSYFTTIKNIRCHIGYQIQPTSATGSTGNSNQSRRFLSGSGHQAQDQAPLTIGSSPTGQPQTISGNLASGFGGYGASGSLNNRLSTNTTNTTTGQRLLQNRKSIGSCQSIQSAAPFNGNLDYKLQLRSQTNQQPNNNLTVSPSDGLNVSSSRQQTSGRPLSYSLGRAGDGGGGKTVAAAAAAAEAVAASSRARRARIGSDLLWRHRVATEVGTDEEGQQIAAMADANGQISMDGLMVDQEQQHHDRVPICSAILEAVVGLFSRRSKRRDSDKVSSIQQHLRAIRHAENLDRQTHFRRSQVQRLAQRFESTEVNPWSFQQQQQQHFDCSRLANESSMIALSRPPFVEANSAADRGPNRFSSRDRTSDGFVNLSASNLSSQLMSNVNGGGQFDWLRDEEAERLLIVLSQLIGAECVWRLARLVTRYCLANTDTPSPIQRDAAARRAGGERKSAARAVGRDSDQSVAAGAQGDDERTETTTMIKGKNNGASSLGRSYFAPLNLELSSHDRKLATKLLQFIEHAARKSMLQLEPGISGGVDNSTVPLALASLESLVAARSSCSWDDKQPKDRTTNRRPHPLASSDCSRSKSGNTSSSASTTSSSSSCASSVSISLGATAAAAATSAAATAAAVAAPHLSSKARAMSTTKSRAEVGSPKQVSEVASTAATKSAFSGEKHGPSEMAIDLCKSEMTVGIVDGGANRFGARGAIQNDKKLTRMGISEKPSGGARKNFTPISPSIQSIPSNISFCLAGGRAYNRANENNNNNNCYMNQNPNHQDLSRELTLVTDDDEDPIKRALDRIRGTSSGDPAKLTASNGTTKARERVFSSWLSSSSSPSPDLALDNSGNNKSNNNNNNNSSEELETRIWSQQQPQQQRSNYTRTTAAIDNGSVGPEVQVVTTTTATTTAAPTMRSSELANKTNAISSDTTAGAISSQMDNCNLRSFGRSLTEPLATTMAKTTSTENRVTSLIQGTCCDTNTLCPGDLINKQQQPQIQRRGRHHQYQHRQQHHHHNQHPKPATEYNHPETSASAAAAVSSLPDNREAPPKRRPCSEERAVVCHKCCCCRCSISSVKSTATHSFSGTASKPPSSVTSNSDPSYGSAMACARCAAARRSQSTCRLCLRLKPSSIQNNRPTSSTKN